METVRYPLRPSGPVAIFGLRDRFDPGDAPAAAFPAAMLYDVWSTLWAPTYPVVIFTGPGYGILTEADRDMIWRRWGVPVYEQRVDAQGRIIAEECDAHEGLHLLDGANWDGPIEQRTCGCGVTGVMIRDDIPASEAAGAALTAAG